MGELSKLARPLINLVTQELLLDRDGFIKIGVVVAEDCPTWDIVLPSLEYQSLKIYAPARFSNLRNYLNKKGAYVISCLVASIRGSKGFMMDVEGFGHHIGKGREEPLHNVVIPLMGRFKKEYWSRHNIQDIVSGTAPKLKVRL